MGTCGQEAAWCREDQHGGNCRRISVHSLIIFVHSRDSRPDKIFARSCHRGDLPYIYALTGVFLLKHGIGTPAGLCPLYSARQAHQIQPSC